MQSILDLVNEPDVDQLRNTQLATAMRTLLLRFSDPFLEAGATAELATARAHDWLVQVVVADETLK